MTINDGDQKRASSFHGTRDTFPPPVQQMMKMFPQPLCLACSSKKKTSQMAGPFDQTGWGGGGGGSLSLMLFILFCGLLVPYWIMKAAREDFCLLRSIRWFHCHNTRRRSETGVWQMACHLRQRDVPCARPRPCTCVCVCVCVCVNVCTLACFFLS